MSANRAKLTPAAGGAAYNPGDPFLVSDQGGFGPRLRDYHVGIDYRAPAGTPIPAASSGEIVYSGPSRGFHYAVMVKSVGSDGKAYYSVYGHVDPEGALSAGTKVSAGQTIGAVGTVHKNEGEESSGPHLHLGIVPEEALNGRPVPGRDGLGFSTGEKGLFVNPDEFTNYADGAPYNARTYIPIRDGLAPRSVPNLAQSRDVDRLLSQQNPANRAGLSPVELNRFYNDTGNHAPDQLASIADGTLRVAVPNGAGGPPQVAPPLQPGTTPTTDGNLDRYLGRFTYDPSQGSPVPARPVPSQPSPDGSLSLNDAYLEYLRRLNAN